MAAYPTLPHDESSRATVDSGTDADRATNGALKAQRLYAADKTSFALEHDLTSAQRTTLDNFYAANKDVDITYTWPATGASFTARFVTAPRYIWQVWGWRAAVRLEQV